MSVFLRGMNRGRADSFKNHLRPNCWPARSEKSWTLHRTRFPKRLQSAEAVDRLRIDIETAGLTPRGRPSYTPFLLDEKPPLPDARPRLCDPCWTRRYRIADPCGVGSTPHRLGPT